MCTCASVPRPATSCGRGGCAYSWPPDSSACSSPADGSCPWGLGAHRRPSHWPRAMSHEPEGAIAQAPESRASVPSPADAGLCSLFVTLSVRPLGGPALPLSSFTLQRGPRERGRPHSQDSLPQAVCAVLTATGAAPSAGGWLCGAGREAPSARPEPPGVSVLHLHLRARSAEVQGWFITQKAATVTKRALGVAEASGRRVCGAGTRGQRPADHLLGRAQPRGRDAAGPPELAVRSSLISRA